MTSKLTLNLKKTTVERGKRYARRKRTSLSKLVESYLDKLTGEPADFEISPLVKSLSNTIKNLPKDRKKSYANYLDHKYR